MDDNRDSARTLAKVLEFDGHIASCLFDGLAVTENVASFRPDVVLLDIGLPGLDGYQVAEQLRRSFPREGAHARCGDGIRRRTRPGPGEARGVRPLPHQAARPRRAQEAAGCPANGDGLNGHGAQVCGELARIRGDCEWVRGRAIPVELALSVIIIVATISRMNASGDFEAESA